MKISAYILGSLLLLAACSNPTKAPPTELSPTASGSLRTWLRSGANDAEEASSGLMVGGSDANILNFSADSQKVGLRFTGVGVPRGAKITKAYVRLMAAESDSGSTTLTIRAHDTDSAGQFSGSSKNISARSLTTAAASWSTPSWSKGVVAQSDDFAEVVQEVVNRRGWNSGNALALVIAGDNRTDRQAVSVDGGGTRVAPTLYVWYEADNGDEDDGDDGIGSGDDGSSDGLSTWNSRLVATIENPKYDNYNGWMNPDRQVAKGDTFSLARNFNNYATNLILAYRESGDRDLIRQLDRLMNIAKGKLEDSNSDGYLNWVYNTRTDSSSEPFIGTDEHVMDEMLSHSMVAAVAYTLKQAGYSSSASYWTDYLKNHFEAKWRRRNNKPEGFPFLKKDLMHPYANFIRYHFYMYKLTGQSSYYAEAKRMAGVVEDHMKSISTPSGTGYTWDHRINDGSSKPPLGCQPTVYIRYTTQAFADLATVDSSLFDATFMKRVANTMAHVVLKNTDGTYLANTICGGKQYGDLYYFVSYPYSTLARWDDSGRLETATRRAYAATERTREDSPRIYNLPAIMTFTLGN